MICHHNNTPDSISIYNIRKDGLKDILKFYFGKRHIWIRGLTNEQILQDKDVVEFQRNDNTSIKQVRMFYEDSTSTTILNTSNNRQINL